MAVRKGDEKKNEILTVAERLFCMKGYADTSIQDILDILHTSKGGFYHHFPSKDAVLKAICEQRALKAAERCDIALTEVSDPLARVNLVLQMMLPLQREELSFIGMLLPTLDQSECAAVRAGYQDALSAAFCPLLNAEIRQAVPAGTLHPVIADAAPQVLLLVNHAWYAAALYVLRCCRGEERYEPAGVLPLLEGARRCTEVLLEAPYGSISLIRLQEWDEVAQQLLNRYALQDRK